MSTIFITIYWDLGHHGITIWIRQRPHRQLVNMSQSLFANNVRILMSVGRPDIAVATVSLYAIARKPSTRLQVQDPDTEVQLPRLEKADDELEPIS